MYNRLIILCLINFIHLSCTNEKKVEEKTDFLFEEISAEESGVGFINQIKEDAKHNIINYIYYYNGGGVAVGDINNDDLPDIFFVSNQGKNALYLNKGDMKFEDISDSSGITGTSTWNTGVSMVDINGDGFLDIYVCAVSKLLDFEGQNELFINNGNGTFTEESKKYGLDYKGYSTQSYFFDYDKDGDLDVYIVNHAVHTTLTHGLASLRNERVPFIGDVLFKNENGKFIDVSDEANIYGGLNGYGLSVAISDFNNDGWEDIYVCNDFHEDDYYYINNKNGSFTESLGESFSTISRFSMGSDAADINNDGYTDLITLDMLPSDERVVKESEGDDAMFNLEERLKRLGYKNQYSRNMLQINTNGSHFSEQAILNGISNTDWSWAPLIADFNNDMHQDVFITNGILRRPNDLDFRQFVSNTFSNGRMSKSTSWLYKSIDEMPNGKVSNKIFKGDSKKFTDKTGRWIDDKPTLSNGGAYADLDLDGDLDLVLNNLNTTASIYENKATKNYLSISLKYKDKNLEGIGAKAFMYANNKIQVKELHRSRGFMSSVDNKLIFGLDSIVRVDSIQVVWPNLKVETVVNPKINQNIVVGYNTPDSSYNFEKNKSSEYFKKTKEIDFLHIEDSYNDFYKERLIPYMLSKQGPAFDAADVDNNGFDDLFIGNSAGKKPVLFLNDGNSFSKTNIPSIESDYLAEDNVAKFIDIDNDNDLDLYVGSGIGTNSFRIESVLEDRLYINVNGTFKKTENQIPPNKLNTSCVISNDYDSDGDLDLFVGNLSNPIDFGLNVKSFLLNNDGNGNFSIDNNFELITKVNSAIWKDINGDGIKDLLVATEWDAPRIFLNLKGKLTEIDIAVDMNGLWQSITSFDIDEDGDQDIILGNWGLNTKFSLNSGPLKMFYNDFDSNGKKEVIIAYNIEGNYYPLNSKDELVSQMNIINKRFLSYKDFALKTIEQIFGDDIIKESKTYEVEKMASGYLENEGGSFKKFVLFPSDFQLAPINSFTEIEIENENHLLVSGNSLKVSTYHGGYTSLKGILLKNIREFKPVSNYGINPFNNQIKGTTVVPMKNKNVLFIFGNNSPVETYSFEKSN